MVVRAAGLGRSGPDVESFSSASLSPGIGTGLNDSTGVVSSWKVVGAGVSFVSADSDVSEVIWGLLTVTPDVHVLQLLLPTLHVEHPL